MSCWLLWAPLDYSPPGSSVHGISQPRILEWIAISFSMGSSWPRDGTCISCIGRQIQYYWATRGAWYCSYWHKISNKDTLTMWLLNWWMTELSWGFSLYFQNHTLIPCAPDTRPESRATPMYSEVPVAVIYVPSISWNRRHCFLSCPLWSQWYLLCPYQRSYVSVSHFSWFWQILLAISQL